MKTQFDYFIEAIREKKKQLDSTGSRNVSITFTMLEEIIKEAEWNIKQDDLNEKFNDDDYGYFSKDI